ncbi:MAG: hypothetical protein LBF84_03970, partial [Holosporales bacterium]|nr:hypothetical protein [Holosporales bacterium]
MKNKNLALAGALLLAVCFSAEGSSFMARFCAAGDAAFLQSPVAPLVKKTTSFRRVIIIGSAAVLGIAAALGLWWYMRAEPEPAPEPGPEPGPVVNPEPVPVMAPPPLT